MDNETLPHSQEAEEVVIASILVSPEESVDLCQELIKPDHFYLLANRLIYQAVLALDSVKNPITTVTICDKLRTEGNLERVGGEYKVHQIATLCPSSVFCRHYCEIIREKYRLREILFLASEMKQSVGKGDNSETLLASTEAKLFSLGQSELQDVNQLQDAVKEVKASIEMMLSGNHTPGLPMGIPSFDEALGGYRPGLYHIFAGIPGGGKTAWAEQSAVYAAQQGKKVLFLSIEMSSKRVLGRMACRKANINHSLFIKGKLGPKELSKVNEALDAIQSTGLIVLSPTDTTGPKIRSLIRRYSRKENIELVVVDYLQLIKSDVQKEPRHAVAEASTALRDAFKETGVPGIVLSQINRDYYKESRPRLSMLAESNQIEKDADSVVFLWSELSKDQQDQTLDIPYLACIEKNRDASCGDVKIMFEGPTMKFKERPKTNLVYETNRY
jgi:replicative DNA helicase